MAGPGIRDGLLYQDGRSLDLLTEVGMQSEQAIQTRNWTRRFPTPLPRIAHPLRHPGSSAVRVSFGRIEVSESEGL